MQLQRREFAGTQPGPSLLISGGVHGDEYTPMAAVRRLIEWLEGRQDSGALRAGAVTLVPVVNEAAFRRGHRTAEDELDLARVCPGDPSGSVTLRAAHALSELIRAADYYIDLHTGGTELSVWPMTGYVLHADAEILAKQREMARCFNLPVVWGTSPHLDGRSLSVARDVGVPAIYTEYLGMATCDQDGVEAYVAGCLNVMGWLGMIERAAPTTRVEHVVEDRRPDSGHMQVCNPSPIDGFFSASVNLGTAVQTGDLLGTVCSPLGDEVHEIRATQTGWMLVLRTSSRVLAGDSIGVVLEP